MGGRDLLNVAEILVGAYERAEGNMDEFGGDMNIDNRLIG